MSERVRLRVHAALLLQTLLSAGTYLVAKHALSALPPAALAMVRFAFASVLLVLLLRITGLGAPPRPALRRVALLGLVAVPLNQGLFLHGLARTTPTHTALLYALTPVFVLIMSAAARLERVDGRRVLGLGLALAGAFVVVTERRVDLLASASALGDLLILGAVISWAAYTVLGRPLIHRNGPLAATAWSLVAGTLIYLPVGVPSVWSVPMAHLPVSVWAAIAFLAVVTSVVNYLLWYYALGQLEPSRVAVFANLQPVATAALSWLLLGEAITPPLVAGGLLVIVGVLVTTQVAEAAPAPE